MSNISPSPVVCETNDDAESGCKMIDRSAIRSAAQEDSVESAIARNKQVSVQHTDGAMATSVTCTLHVVTPHLARRKRKTETERLWEDA